MTQAQRPPDTTRDYLKEIARVPMLTHEQEITLGKVVYHWQGLKAQIEPELAKGLELRQAELLVGLKPGEYDRASKAGQRAKDKMVSANLRLVVSIAKKYQDRGVDLMDLIADGNLGLIRGIEKFDPSKGYRLSTYTYWWIRQSITRGIAEKSRVIRLPIHISEKLNRRKRAIKALATELQRVPTADEIADRMELSRDDYEKLITHARNVLSLDMLVGEAQDTTLGELIEGDSPQQDFGDLRRVADRYLSRLSSQEELVVSYRFGLGDGVSRSLAEIGAMLNLSRERIRQVERSAFQKIRAFAQRNGGFDRELLS